MKYLRFSIIVMIVVTCGGLNAQSPYNSYFYGLFIDHMDAASFGMGNSGLLPGMYANVSIGNPSTWPEFRFAFLSAHYHTGDIRYEKDSYLSGFGRLSNATFIIPIKQKYAIGLGIKPLSRKDFQLEGELSNLVILGQDTLSQTKKIEGEGGISSFYIALSWKINEKNTLAIQLDYYFGTMNEYTSSLLYKNNYLYVSPIVYQRQFNFDAKLVSLYYLSRVFYDPYKMIFYGALQFVSGSKEIYEKNYPPFIDLNEDNIHSINELPYLDNTEVLTFSHKDISVPMIYAIGVVYRLTGKTTIGFEWMTRTFSYGKIDFLNSIPSQKKEGSYINLNLLREARPGAHEFVQRLHYRIGIFHHRYYISSRRNSVYQNGIAMGIGIPFGFIQNQIDFGLRFSKRKGFLSTNPEIIREITVGLSLGDVWLRKGKRR